VKIGPVVSAEYIVIEIALHVHIVVQRISSNISGCTGPIFAIFSPYESALRANDWLIDNLIFQFVKGLCHDNQILLPYEGKLILRAFFARLPDGSTVSFRYYLLGGDTAAPSGLLTRLCHAFLALSFLMISSRCRMHWTDFDNLFTKWKHFGCRWTIWTSFSDISRDVAWQPIL